jgi:hypothetical protein
MAAARAMFDAEHGMPEEKGEADDNCYFLGRIGGHNVVIACLPAGSRGSASAATVAAQMLHTFQRIRFGLLVGIGSGAPSVGDNIRLGDVVVSMPSAGTGGVIHYKCTAFLAGTAGSAAASDNSGVEVVRTHSLNKPPAVLRTALTSLQAEHELTGTRICELLTKAMEVYPKLRTKLMPPTQDGNVAAAAATDRLYKSQ